MSADEATVNKIARETQAALSVADAGSDLEYEILRTALWSVRKLAFDEARVMVDDAFRGLRGER